MTKKGKRRTSSVEHRSTKRRKPGDQNPVTFSTRIITWEEQLTLPPRFHEEQNVWPALRILEERGIGRKKEYLLEWEAHPETGEVFEPTWEPADNVGQELKQEWKTALAIRRSSVTSPQSLSTSSPPSVIQPNAPLPLTNARRINNRRIIPDSSAETDDGLVQESSPSQTPALTESPGSTNSASVWIEISETQQPHHPASVRVNVPPAPDDKSDWESLRDSQFSSYKTSNTHSSPFGGGFLPNSSSNNQRTPVQRFGKARSTGSKVSSHEGSSSYSRSQYLGNRVEGVGKILNYESLEDGLVSVADLAQYSTAPQQPGSLNDRPQGFASAQLLDIASPHASGSRADSYKPASDTALVLKEQEAGLSPISTTSISRQTTQPWGFQSQIPLQQQSDIVRSTDCSKERPALSGRCARKTFPSSASQDSSLSFSNSRNSATSSQLLSQTGMAARGTRQSPRLSTVTPHSNATSPRIAVRTTSLRGRTGHNPPEHSSPLATSAEFAEMDQSLMQYDNPEGSFVNSPQDQHSPDMSMIPPTSIAPSAMHIDPNEASLISPSTQASNGYDSGLNTLTMTVQDSIEEESSTSSAEETSLASKASSSQDSLHNERSVSQVEGLLMPTCPILGEDEYAIALPAEGKVQAIYHETIRLKRKAILKFIHRRGTVNTASTNTKKTIERNEMIELIGRLHDTTTHIDLGLPGTPTQYTIPSQEHASYAEYAGSKFVFLGYLMDYFRRRPDTIVIMAKSGATQDLLEEYLYMKNVAVHRHERAHQNPQLEYDASANPRVEIISTKPDKIVDIARKPSLIIAFDASFESLDVQVRSLRAMSTKTIPILHLMVYNSSEHVDRCLPPSMPSPVRLRLLVRATYQAHMNLGGSPSIITNPSDELNGRQMDLGDINRAVRKTPNRRLQMVAAVVANAVLSENFALNWTLAQVPDLIRDEIEESPESGSTDSATPGRSRKRSVTPVLGTMGQSQNRSDTPLSRATTPSTRKRQLEVDTTDLAVKRQRMTPLGEHSSQHDAALTSSQEQGLRQMVDLLRIELANEKQAREIAEQAKTVAKAEAVKWRSSLAALQHRYEKRTQKSHEQQRANKTLTTLAENSKLRVEKVIADNANLRNQLAQQRQELAAARADLKVTDGDVAVLETAREEARKAIAGATVLEKSLSNTKRDFDFVRAQYQDASNRAAELGTQVTSLESQVSDLATKASDEKRKLREMNFSDIIQQHLTKIQQLEAEGRSTLVLYRKLEEENKLLKRSRGVQTRGSSTAPGSPGQRSRQGSPNASSLAPPTGSRASVLRNER